MWDKEREFEIYVDAAEQFYRQQMENEELEDRCGYSSQKIKEEENCIEEELPWYLENEDWSYWGDILQEDVIKYYKWLEENLVEFELFLLWEKRFSKEPISFYNQNSKGVKRYYNWKIWTKENTKCKEELKLSIPEMYDSICIYLKWAEENPIKELICIRAYIYDSLYGFKTDLEIMAERICLWWKHIAAESVYKNFYLNNQDALYSLKEKCNLDTNKVGEIWNKWFNKEKCTIFLVHLISNVLDRNKPRENLTIITDCL